MQRAFHTFRFFNDGWNTVAVSSNLSGNWHQMMEPSIPLQEFSRRYRCVSDSLKQFNMSEAVMIQFPLLTAYQHTRELTPVLVNLFPYLKDGWLFSSKMQTSLSLGDLYIYRIRIESKQWGPRVIKNIYPVIIFDCTHSENKYIYFLPFINFPYQR